MVCWVNNITAHCFKGMQKSKFKNAVFGLKPSYLILTTMFEPKNLNTSTFRAQKLSMSEGTFLLDVWNTANLLSKMPFLNDQKCQNSIKCHRCHPLWDGLLYYIFHSILIIGSGKYRKLPFLDSEYTQFSFILLNKLLMKLVRGGKHRWNVKNSYKML